jgi:transcriptional regulator with XRE-family HTH domain
VRACCGVVVTHTANTAPQIGLACNVAFCKYRDMQNASSNEIAERLRAAGVSASYASQLSRSVRKPSQRLAIRLYREAGVKLGPIANATDDEISALESLLGKAA